MKRLRQDAQAHGRTGSLIELLALATLADVAAGRREQALQVLQQALTLAMEEGYVRVFLDEGAPMYALLAQSAECRAQNDSIRVYAQRLLGGSRSAEQQSLRSTLDARTL